MIRVIYTAMSIMFGVGGVLFVICSLAGVDGAEMPTGLALLALSIGYELKAAQ